MKKFFSLLIVSAAIICLMLVSEVHRRDIRAAAAQPTGGPATSFEPTGFRRERPFPGHNYPWQPTNQAPPAAWPTLPPEGIDLDVTYINRSPMYKAYCIQYPGGIPILCPGTENEKRWPDPGEVVTYTAHVINKGTQASPAFEYKWFIDESEVASGTLPGLAPDGEGTAVYQWVWAHTMDGERVVDDHTIRFTVDPTDVISETYEINNSLLDRTNALGFHIAITPEMVEAYNTPWDPAFSYSAEDWLQRQIAAMNWSLANSIYSTTPAGASERVRINWIEITATPPVNDGSHDGGWFVDADYRLVSGGYDPTTDVDWNLVHELSHQVGLIDLYNLDIAVTSVEVLDREGIPANFGFSWPRRGLMGGGDIFPHTDHHLYSSHSAAGISSTRDTGAGIMGSTSSTFPNRSMRASWTMRAVQPLT